MVKKKEINLDIKEMLKVGLHFGHRASKTHPKMHPFIFGMRNTVHIIDLEKTKVEFEKALKFIESLIVQGKTLLFIGTKIQWRDQVQKTAKDLELPYITERWAGGTFTNFEVIKKRIDYLKELEGKKKSGELEKYPPKEKADFEKKLRELELKFGGIKNMEKLPDVIFVWDMRKDALAIKEARKVGVKVIGVADTNVDPTLADYPIPANDDAISSIKYILEKVKEVILKAKSEKSSK